MNINPSKIFEEYRQSLSFKQSMGSRGLIEQNRLNERFFNGDQWYGAKCGNDRPLVRYNVIKRIGEYKMAQVLSNSFNISFSADGVSNTVGLQNEIKRLRSKLSAGEPLKLSAETDEKEIAFIMSALSDYHRITAERLGFTSICERILRNAFICGSAVLYTYWDEGVKTGLYADDKHSMPISGDISCEVLDIENVFFADPYTDDVQRQPYIIIASRIPLEQAQREAKRNGSKDYERISADSDGKVLVLTRLHKEYKDNGEVKVLAEKVCENAVIKPMFDTWLSKYPLSLFSWDRRGRLIYGESEVTYLIPNQIAINRMITANVWATMSAGMPIMVVNGDTVADEITNDPGQILKVYGSNEDVKGAVNYINPPEFSEAFSQNIKDMIENTLTQSGVNEAARGDSQLNNATALINLRNAATLPLQLIQNRFYAFIEEVARCWIEFWLKMYGNRKIKLSDENGVWYIPFCAERYKGLEIIAGIDVATNGYNSSQSISLLSDLFEKGIINKKQYLKRLPKGIVPAVSELLYEIDGEDTKNDGQ